MKTSESECVMHLHEKLDCAVMVISIDWGEMLFVNRYVCDTLNMGVEEIQGRCYTDIFEPEFSDMYADLASECTDDQMHSNIFFWRYKSLWEQVTARRIEWLDKRPAILLNIVHISDISRFRYEYRHMAHYDLLLGLPNGLKLEMDLAAMSSFDNAALLHFDINQLANINMLYGWEVGDGLLMRIRDWLHSTMRRTTTRLYRVSDDEFCLFGQDISLELVKDRAAMIMQRFAQPWKVHSNGNRVLVHCSIKMGVVHGKHVSGDMRNILRRTTSESHRTAAGYALYDEKRDSLLRNQLRLRHELVNCINEEMQGFSVHYQPVVDAQNNQWIGAEALCRWTPPGGEPVPPGVFIPELEKLGMLLTVDGWVRETALSQCMDWGLHRRNFFLDINLSPLQQVTDNFIDSLLAVVDRLGYPRSKLTLEITESAKMDFSDDNLKGLHRLRDEGIILALDDFGTGYSTFENLAKIPAGILKTERMFIQSIETDSYFQYLMQVMVDIAHTVGMKLISEGVESEAQRNHLRSYQVDYLQGYLFSKPLPPHLFAEQVHRFMPERASQFRFRHENPIRPPDAPSAHLSAPYGLGIDPQMRGQHGSGHPLSPHSVLRPPSASGPEILGHI